MVGENDFFLKFGSNAESFADEVSAGVDAAYQQIGRLSESVSELNLKLRESPARDFLSSLQDEMRGVSRAISRTLSSELRTALSRDLPNIVQGLGVTVQAEVVPGQGGGARGGQTQQRAGSLQNEFRELGRSVSRTLATELRTALARDLPGIVRGLTPEVTAGGGGRTSATATPEADRVAAEARREVDALGGTLGQFRRYRQEMDRSTGELRNLLPAIDAMTDAQKMTFARIKMAADRLRGEISVREARTTGTRGESGPVRETEVEIGGEGFDRIKADAARADIGLEGVAESSAVVDRELDVLRSGLQDLNRVLATVFQAAQTTGSAQLDVPTSEARLRAVLRETGLSEREERTPGREGTAELDPESLRLFVSAAQTQAQAADTMNAAVNRLGGHLDVIQTALQNVRVTEGAEAAAPRQVEGQRDVAQQTGQAMGVATDLLSDARRYTQNLYALLEPLRGEGLKARTYAKRSRDVMETDPRAAEVGQNLGSLIGEENVSAVFQKLRSQGADLDAVMEIVEGAMREQAPSVEQVTQSEREVVAVNNEVVAAKRREANASEAAAQATERATVAQGRAVGAGGPQVGPAVPTDIANRRFREQTRRQRELSQVVLGRVPEGATDVSDEMVGLREQIAATYEPIFDVDQVMNETFERLNVGGAEAPKRRIDRMAEREAMRRQLGLESVEDLPDDIIPDEPVPQTQRNAVRDAHRERMRDLWQTMDDDFIQSQRQYLQETTGRAGPRLDVGDLGGSAVRGVVASTIQQAPGRQRQDRLIRALELSETLQDQPGSLVRAQRGGSIERMNELLTQAGAPRVSSRAEAEPAIARLGAELRDILRGMGPGDREQFEAAQGMDRQARQELIENRRRLAESNHALVEFTRQLIRTTTTMIPTGPARAPDILQREMTGREYQWGVEGAQARGVGDAEMERVRQAQEAVNLSELRDRVQGVAVAWEAMSRFPDLEVADLENLQTTTGREGRIKRIAMQELEHLDEAMTDAFIQQVNPSEALRVAELRNVRPDEFGRAMTDLYDSLPEPPDPQTAAALRRVRDRQNRQRRDEEEYIRKVETTAATRRAAGEEWAGGRTEQLQRGGIRSLARFVERPEEMGLEAGRGVWLNRLRPQYEEETMARYQGQPGGEQYARSLIDTYNRGIAEAFELNQQRMLRGEALSARGSAEAQQAINENLLRGAREAEAAGDLPRAEQLRGQLFDIDERSLAQADRIITRTEGVNDRLQATLQMLFRAPDPVADRERFLAQGGQSIEQLVRGGTARDVLGDVEDLSPENAARLAARQATRAALAERAGVTEEVARTRTAGEAETLIQERLGPDVDVQGVMREAGNIAVQRIQQEQANLQAQRQVNETFRGLIDRMAAAARVMQEGPQIGRSPVREEGRLVRGEGLRGAIADVTRSIEQENQRIQREIAAVRNQRTQAEEIARTAGIPQEQFGAHIDYAALDAREAELRAQMRPTYPEARARFRETEGLDTELFQRVGMGVANPTEINRFVDAMGGMDQVIGQLGRTFGVFEDVDVDLSDRPELQAAPEALAQTDEMARGARERFAQAAMGLEEARARAFHEREGGDIVTARTRLEREYLELAQALEVERVQVAQLSPAELAQRGADYLTPEERLADREAQVLGAQGEYQRLAREEADVERRAEAAPEVVEAQEVANRERVQLTRAETEVAQQARLVAEREALLTQRQAAATENVAARAGVEQDFEALLAGRATEGAGATREGLAQLAQRQLTEQATAARELGAIVGRVGQQAGLGAAESRGARSFGELAQRVDEIQQGRAVETEGIAGARARLQQEIDELATAIEIEKARLASDTPQVEAETQQATAAATAAAQAQQQEAEGASRVAQTASEAAASLGQLADAATGLRSASEVPEGAVRAEDEPRIQVDHEALDARKQEIVEQAKAHLAEFRPEMSEQIENLQLEDLFLVHETPFEPQIDEQGSALLRPFGDYNPEFPRDTLHFALNHLVEGVVGRGAGGEGVEGTKAIVSKLTDVLAANPNALDNLYGIDTFLSPEPGEALRLPNAKIIEDPQGAGREELSRFLEEQGSMTFPGGEHYQSLPGLDARIAEMASELGVTSQLHSNWEAVESAFTRERDYTSRAVDEFKRAADKPDPFDPSRPMQEVPDPKVAFDPQYAEHMLQLGSKNYRERAARRDIWEPSTEDERASYYEQMARDDAEFAERYAARAEKFPGSVPERTETIEEARQTITEAVEAQQVPDEGRRTIAEMETELARLQQQRQALERQVQREPIETGRMGTAEAAELRARGLGPTIPIPAMDQTKVALAEFLEGGAKGYRVGDKNIFSQRLEDILSKGEAFARAPEGGAGTGAQTAIRNQLALLAGEEYHRFATPTALEERAGYTRAQARRVGGQRTDIDEDLLSAARTGARATAAELLTEGDLGAAQARTVEQTATQQLLRVLTSLEASISELSNCCRAMQESGGGPGGTVDPDALDRRRRLEAIREERLRTRVQGRLPQQVGSRIEQGQLTEAAMELMADPNLRFSAQDARRVVASMYDEQTEVRRRTDPDARRMGQGQVDRIDDRLITAERMRGISEGAFGAFRSGDIENTARAVLKAKGDVQVALNEVGSAFSLTSEQVAALRGPLEQYQAQLQQEQVVRERTQARELTEGDRLRMEVAGRSLPGRAGQVFDPEAPDRLENARGVMGAMFEEGASLQQVLSALGQTFRDLSYDARRVIEAEARLEQERRESVMAARMAEEAEERLQRLRSLLPRELRSRLDAGQLSGREVAQQFEATGMGNVRATQKTARDLQTIIDEGQQARLTGAIDPAAIADRSRVAGRQAGDAFIDQYVQSVQQGGGIGNALFGPKGSMVGNVIRTAGNFIGRYIGGAIVFGLAHRLKELVGVALETEQTFIRVSAALDATGKSADGVRARLQDIAVSTNVDLASTYEVMAQLVGVFDDVDEAARATEVVAQMELISQGALSAREGYRALSAVVTSFQDTLMETRGLDQEGAITYVADLATRLQDITGVNIEDTIEGVGRLGETANSMGIELEFLASTLALAGKATGQTGTVVSEAFGRVLSQLQDTKATDMLVRMGITDEATVRARNFQQVMIDIFENFDDLNAGQRRQLSEVISDPRQFYIVNAALQQGSNILDIWAESQNNAGAAAERTEEILGTLRGQLGQLGKQVQVFVENLVALGVLNAFGVVVKGAGLFLRIMNEILQILNRVMEASPFLKMATQIGMAAAGMRILMMLTSGLFAQMGRHLGVPDSRGVRDTVSGVRARRAAAADAAGEGGGFWGRRRAPMYGPPAPLPHTIRKRWGADPDAMEGMGRVRRTTARGANALSASLTNVSRRFPAVAQRASLLTRRLGHMARGLRANGGALLQYGLVLALIADMVTRKARDMQSHYDNLYRSTPKAGETPEEATERRAEQERQDYIRRTSQAQGPRGMYENLGEFMTYGTSSWGNFGRAAATIGSGVIPGLGRYTEGAGDALAGVVHEDQQAILDEYLQSALGIRDDIVDDEEALAEALALRDQLIEDAHDIIESQPTTAGKAEAARQIDAEKELIEAIARSRREAIDGLIGVTNFTFQQIESSASALQFVAGLDNRARALFGSLIQDILGAQGLPPEAVSALDAANRPGMNYGDRLQANIDAIDMLIEQADTELQEAIDQEGPEEIDRARQMLEGLMAQRMEYDAELLQSLVNIPQAQGEYALRFGQYAQAERLLSQAAEAARQNAREADPGSQEQVEAFNTALDLQRQSVEASIQNTVLSLEMASAATRDPLTQLGNSLEIARTRLEAAIANPGAFTPDEIAGFINEIAQSQQQIADFQDEVTSALAALRAEQTGNPLEKAHVEYAEALRQYRRTIDENMGAPAIINAAREAEAAARSVREQREELRAARAALAIARLPQGDSIAVAMGELGEAFDAQRHIIREFGRESSEYLQSVQSVLESRRAVEQAINEVASAHASVASALARAAGLDIESARIDLGEAQRELQAALREAGGNESAAIVQEAMARVIEAEAAMRDTVLSEATDTIDFLMDMGDITANEAIAALQEIMSTMDLTEDQRRDLMRKIKGLQDDIANSLSGGFNIADVRLPTPYEVRRSLGVDEIREGVEEGREALQGAFAEANEAFDPGAGGSVLDAVLGTDLADEVRNVGQGVDALLPPLSEVPTLVEETIATRDAVVAQLTSQLEATVALTEAQNASIAMLGATIFPPMDAIREQVEYANSLAELSATLLNTGNEYLESSDHHLNHILEEITGVRLTMEQLIGMNEERLARRRPRDQEDRPDWGRGFKPPGPQLPLPDPDIAPWFGGDLFGLDASSIAPRREPGWAGAFRPSAAEPTSNIQQTFQTSVVVQAETNADPNAIARVVEKRVNNGLRRQMNSNQSTPHMIRMR